MSLLALARRARQRAAVRAAPEGRLCAALETVPRPGGGHRASTPAGRGDVHHGLPAAAFVFFVLFVVQTVGGGTVGDCAVAGG